MKKFLFALTLLATFGTIAKADIEFNHGPWKEILAQATQQNKIVFVDAYTTWCGPCKWMAANTFTNPEVADFFNANFINAKIDMEKGEGPSLAQKYHVNAYPTLLFVAGNGELVHVAIGAIDAAAFLELGRNVLAPEYMTLPRMKAKYASGKFDRAFHADYILKMKEAGENIDAPLEAFKPGMDGAALLQEENWEVFKALFMKLDSGPAQYFFAHQADFEKNFGKDIVSAKALSMYASPMVRAIYNNGTEADYQSAKNVLLASGVAGAQNKALELDIAWYEHQEDWASFANATCEMARLTPDISAGELNSIAWSFYEHVADPKMLKKALEWANDACKEDPQYAYLDTKAMLQMKLGLKKDAIATANAAIEAAKATGEDASSTEQALKKMQGK
jgi:thiol-disulfide isomerase/thioredoxin